MDAKFSLEVSPGAVLEVSYIGYQTQEVKVGDRVSLSVTLAENQQILDEVVVVGYGTTSRKNLTTSIATVKTEKISKAATSNISGMLLGRAAGLQATVASPQPGGGINISIRGGGTPIYVVDGVVMPSGSFEVGTGSTSLPSSVNRDVYKRQELGWAEDIGMNCMRVYLHHLVWETDKEGFKKRINEYLTIADKHHISTIFVFLDDCWNPTYQEMCIRDR